MYRRYGHEISEMFGRQITSSNPSYQNPLPSFFYAHSGSLKKSLRAVEGGGARAAVESTYSPQFKIFIHQIPFRSRGVGKV